MYLMNLIIGSWLLLSVLKAFETWTGRMMRNIIAIIMISLLIKLSTARKKKSQESQVSIKIGGVPIIIPDFEVGKPSIVSSTYNRYINISYIIITHNQSKGGFISQ